MSIEAGILYVVATPIGNLGDITPRALEVLQGVDVIAAEDTRHSGVLLRHFGIDTRLVALHEHNEQRVCGELALRLERGESIALISDAGTPLISDPGFHLIREAAGRGLKLVPIPGASATITALSVSALPTDRFVFEGFLPAKGGARRKHLESLREEPRTLIFFEAPHRILDTLVDMVAIFGAERPAVLARELTKTFETLYRDTLEGVRRFVETDSDQRRGEIVLMLHGAPRREAEAGLEPESCRVATLLAESLPVKQAAQLTARITGAKKNLIYEYLVKGDGEAQ